MRYHLGFGSRIVSWGFDKKTLLSFAPSCLSPHSKHIMSHSRHSRRSHGEPPWPGRDEVRPDDRNAFREGPERPSEVSRGFRAMPQQQPEAPRYAIYTPVNSGLVHPTHPPAAAPPSAYTPGAYATSRFSQSASAMSSSANAAQQQCGQCQADAIVTYKRAKIRGRAPAAAPAYGYPAPTGPGPAAVVFESNPQRLAPAVSLSQTSSRSVTA
ncbi:hypothetical protein DFH09DRAFT_1178283 [Mycena vulgaris]|nr:hypothetical protein DFH09DRAFT_1178283 [Mycena vulgaris]